MHYGNPPHVPSLNDRTIIGCPTCGWTSHEMTQEEYNALGIPHWCGNPNCNAIASRWVTFAPHERAEALSIMSIEPISEEETRLQIAGNRATWEHRLARERAIQEIIEHASNSDNWVKNG